MAEVATGFVSIALDRLVKADWNYKTEDPVKQAKLVENLKRNGQVESIIVRELPTGFFEVVNGNHRRDAFEEIGLDEAMCYNVGDISLPAAQRLAIETNETSFASDQVKLSELIKEIEESFDLDDLAATMPWTAEELEAKVKALDYDWDQFKEEGQTYEPGEYEGQTKEVKFRCAEETFNVWLKWVDRCREILGYDSEDKAFELAVVEALNIPEESLSR